jgi:hypothetical protein
MQAARRLTAILAAIAIATGAGLQGQVAIDEIHYHPRSDLQEDEFIEIHNPGPSAVDLSGWAFTDGVDFRFPQGARIAAGGHLAIARDAARIRGKYGLGPDEVLGDFAGALSNGGEEIRLEDAAGDLVDRVRYGDEFPWPTEPDGGGPSLECVDPLADNGTARDWLPSERGASWVEVSVEGAAPSNRLYFYLEGAGECLIDAISISESGSPVNLFPAGDFEGGAAGWSMAGSHSGSRITTSEAWSGSASLHVIATGPGSSADTSITRTIDAIVPGRSYLMTFRAKPLSGNSSLISRVSGGFISKTDLRSLEGTPARENSRRGENLRPLVADVGTDPALPLPGAPARLLASVSDEDLVDAGGTYDPGDGPHPVPLRDDGIPPDLVKGDWVFTGTIPGLPRGSIVDFRVFAADAAGNRVETPARRYPVGSFDVASNLPVYHIFIRQADWDRLNADIWTEEYFPAVFVYGGEVFTDAGLRFRGGRPRLFRKKSLKVAFSDEHPFGDRDRLNLNAAAMDDDYLTEPLAYWFYERAGVDASRAGFARVHLNGAFWGLFIEVEGVDETYLRKRDLDPEGALYKAVGVVGSLRKLDGILYGGQEYSYESQYEKKIREGEPYGDLKAFIEGLYATPASGMENFLEDNLDVERFIRYLAATNLMCVWDSIQHNYYLHRDTLGTGRWRVLPWDLDHAWGEWEWQYHHGDTFHVFMGTESHPFAGVWYTWNRLWTVLIDAPRLRGRYLLRVRDLLETRYAEGPIFGKIDELRAQIEETALLDEARWPDALEPLHAGPMRTMAEEIPLLKDAIARRRAYLAGVVGADRPDIPSPAPFRRGDANGDGSVDIGDPIAVLGYLFAGRNGLECADGADGDDSGAIDLADAVLVLRYLFQDGPAPASPGPAACGQDAGGSLGCDYSNC